MWNRDEKARPSGTSSNPAPASLEPSVTPGGFVRERVEPQRGGEEMASIGKSIVIKGELSGGEDLTIEGEVEGKIELRDHVVTIGSNGRIKAQITAKSIVVLGHVAGNLIATDKVDIQESGSVEGDVVAPRVAIADGSHFRGSIDMQRKESSVSTERGAGRHKPEAKAPMPAVAPVNDHLASV
jgi:cytoskeletal protein CcmA (bactofilin family)